MRATFITTVRHNPGDDFVREGIIHLLRRALGDEPLEVELVHKHAPVTARRHFEWVRRKELSAVLDVLPLHPARDRVLGCDVLIQSGAPVYWCHAEHACSRNEWYGPLVRRRHRRVRDRVPLLNLAAGACQPYHSDGGEFHADPSVLAYVRDLHERSAVTTVRDRLAEQLLGSLGLHARRIPCASIFAGEALGISARTPEYVALNFMPLGGHYDLAQDVRRERWRRSFSVFYREAKRRARCILVCHDRRELRAARAFDPGAEIFFSSDYRDYVRFYAGAAAGVLNRVHGAFMIASFGRPSFVVGNDSRSHMAEEIGLEHAFVEDVDADRLLDRLDHCLETTERFAGRFAAIRRRAEADYLETLSVPLGRAAG